MFLPGRGRPKYRVKQAGPANHPARCFTHVFRFDNLVCAPRLEPRVSDIRGSRLFKRICGHMRAERNRVVSLDAIQSGSPPGAVNAGNAVNARPIC